MFYLLYCRATRNPYSRSKISGGSSGGSAAVVASGLCPVALGVDGGGNFSHERNSCFNLTVVILPDFSETWGSTSLYLLIFLMCNLHIWLIASSLSQLLEIWQIRSQTCMCVSVRYEYREVTDRCISCLMYD